MSKVWSNEGCVGHLALNLHVSIMHKNWRQRPVQSNQVNKLKWSTMYSHKKPANLHTTTWKCFLKNWFRNQSLRQSWNSPWSDMSKQSLKSQSSGMMSTSCLLTFSSAILTLSSQSFAIPIMIYLIAACGRLYISLILKKGHDNVKIFIVSKVE